MSDFSTVILSVTTSVSLRLITVVSCARHETDSARQKIYRKKHRTLIDFRQFKRCKFNYLNLTLYIIAPLCYFYARLGSAFFAITACYTIVATQSLEVEKAYN